MCMRKKKDLRQYEYLAQLNKIQRSYDRLEKCFDEEAQKEVAVISNPEIKDLCTNLFTEIYHFKDWLKKDAEVPKEVKNLIEQFVGTNEYLSVCGDISNQSKHKELTSRRSKAKKYENVLMHTKLDLDPLTGFSTSYNATIKVDDNQYNALMFAEESVKAWKKFLKKNFLTY